MILIFNPPAFIIAIVSGPLCFLVFGLGLSHLIGRPDLVDFNTQLSALSCCLLFDLLLRAGGPAAPGRNVLDPRLGAHFFYAPLWCWSLLGICAVIHG